MPIDVCKTMLQVRGSRGYQELLRRMRGPRGYTTLWAGSSATFLTSLAGHLPWYSTYNYLGATLPMPAMVVASPGNGSGRSGGGKGIGEADAGEVVWVTPVDRTVGKGLVAAVAPERPSDYFSSSCPPLFAWAWWGAPWVTHTPSKGQDLSKPPLPRHHHQRHYCLYRTDDPGLFFTRALRNGFIGFSASVVSDCITNCLRVVKAIRQAEAISYVDAAKLVIRADGLPGLFGRGLKVSTSSRRWSHFI
jgi:hypothetical protein